MILSESCYLKDQCNKFKRDNSCCADNNSTFCIKLFKLDYLYNEALLTAQQRKHVDLYIDADNSDRDAFIELKQIEQNITDFIQSGRNIYLYSANTGNGKTAWALRLLQAYFKDIWHKCDFSCKGLFINIPRFFLSLKDNIDSPNEYISHIKDHVLDADLVIWDEVGVKSLTTYEHENLLNLINSRIDEGKSNIYTSNLSPALLKERVGDRLYSRIINTSSIFEFKGKDKRGLQK